MKAKMTVKYIAVNAILAALYAAFTVAISPIAYGAIQFRLSEILVFFAFYNRKYFPGIILGCFIANLFSSMLVYDITFGTAATALVCFGMYYGKYLFKKRSVPSLFFAAFVGAVINGLLVGLELYLAFQEPFWFSAATVALGELGVLVIGAVIFIFIEKIRPVRRILDGSMFEAGAK